MTHIYVLGKVVYILLFGSVWAFFITKFVINQHSTKYVNPFVVWGHIVKEAYTLWLKFMKPIKGGQAEWIKLQK